MSLTFNISSSNINILTDTEKANPNDLHVGMPVIVPKMYPTMKKTLPIKNIKVRPNTYFYSKSKHIWQKAYLHYRAINTHTSQRTQMTVLSYWTICDSTTICSTDPFQTLDWFSDQKSASLLPCMWWRTKVKPCKGKSSWVSWACGIVK